MIVNEYQKELKSSNATHQLLEMVVETMVNKGIPESRLSCGLFTLSVRLCSKLHVAKACHPETSEKLQYLLLELADEVLSNNPNINSSDIKFEVTFSNDERFYSDQSKTVH